ncbi:MAG TPA: glycosyltransferase [Acidimicrobiales bacterium]|nr:glycosyltransferase [Acidimicrobiales bacterium]
MRSLAVLSMHTSPLAQPGAGDGGGMNVYVRELCTSLARSGTQCDVFTRASSPDQPAVLPVEPGLRVHHVEAGPLRPVGKAELAGLVGSFADAVEARLSEGPWGPGPGAGWEPAATGAPGGVEAIHAHYWLSGEAGHILKHRWDVPLVSTFHTLERVKAASGASDGADDASRTEIEARIIGCSDAVVASNPLEAEQLLRLYGAAPERLHIVSPGVDHAFFAPGARAQARRALGLPTTGPMLLFIGRVQPAKGADLAVGTLCELAGFPDAFLVVAGGPSGPDGEEVLARMRRDAARAGLGDRVFWFPPQQHELVSTFCRAADVCLVPSRTESFGLVALEAAACGVPVVATAVGGLRTIVRDGVTGVLVDERSPAAFADAVKRVLGDPDGAREMGRAAAAGARRYTWGAAAEALRRLHSDLAERILVECG